MHATGVGLVLLAHADTRLQEDVLRGPLTRYSPRTIAEPERLRVALAAARGISRVLGAQRAAPAPVRAP